MSQAVVSPPSAVRPTPVVAAPAGRRTSLAAGLFRTARPKQWLKNVLVFAAPGAAGVLGQPRPLLRALLAFAIFSMVASGTYFLNDALDVVADRLHPKKRNRPVAAGVVGVGLARVAGVALAAVGLGLSFVLGLQFSLIIAVYLALQVAYSIWLKHMPIFDLAAVAAGFVLRAIAGGVAVSVPISEWFLIVATFGSLFMVTGKRSAEYTTMGAEGRAHRATLGVYSPAFLRSILVTTSTVTIAAYCLWAFENQKAAHFGIWFQLSIIPFVLAMFQYALLLDKGQGGQPEDVVLGDRTLEILAVIWAILWALGVYG